MSELVDFTLRLVRKTNDGFVFAPRARRGLRMALDDLFRAPVDKRKELVALLRLGAVFEKNHGAPGIARALVRWIAQDPRAVRALGIRSSRDVAEVRRRLARLGREAAPFAAPRHDASRPVGTVKLSAFLNPGQQQPRVPMKQRMGRPAAH